MRARTVKAFAACLVAERHACREAAAPDDVRQAAGAALELTHRRRDQTASEEGLLPNGLPMPVCRSPRCWRCATAP
jgi:hypothetical protein